MNRFISTLALTALPLICSSGCQTVQVEAPSRAPIAAVNSEVARHMAQNVDQTTDSIHLRAGDRFGELMHDHYLQLQGSAAQ